jgi:hypothetical protein
MSIARTLQLPATLGRERGNEATSPQNRRRCDTSVSSPHTGIHQPTVLEPNFVSYFIPVKLVSSTIDELANGDEPGGGHEYSGSQARAALTGGPLPSLVARAPQ